MALVDHADYPIELFTFLNVRALVKVQFKGPSFIKKESTISGTITST